MVAEVLNGCQEKIARAAVQIDFPVALPDDCRRRPHRHKIAMGLW
jgi:hypothetical protein